MVLPKPGASDPHLHVVGTVRVPSEKFCLSKWVEEENLHGHYCQCGCGRRIRVLAWHRARGIPRFLRAHGPTGLTKETARYRAEGYLTATDVARQLGIGQTTLRRLEGKLFEQAPRRGTRKIRVFTPDQLPELQVLLKKETLLGPAPELIPLGEVARRAGCCRNTIRARLGKELPAGRLLTHPRTSFAFTPEEAEQIVAWIKQYVGTRPTRHT
ncbi:hypothetical protein [Polyangium fumosum]|uniref:Helix-turn-helix domain-containing protein n=1 Tax=Polyangium fumosum TaxID=889272 RepID=A0A4U1IUV7_9BACT|nr:hypothetical protein [Polyangium fumosum]TKC98181.1 hypothetical protein E8A74_42390 [Polyangium fumosum]